MKPVKCSVAAVIRHPEHPDRFLAVLRPPDDDRLPDVWGLPAVSLRPGELPEDALRRVGSEKLGVGIEPARFVGIRSADRGDHELILMDLEARLVEGTPSASAATTSATRYVDQRWTDDPRLLLEAARRGSLCSQLLLDEAGVAYRTAGPDPLESEV